METNNIRDSIKHAITELHIAENELNRPQEDVVKMAVCYSARNSMNTLLRLFLLSKGNNHNEEKSLTELHNQCVKMDRDFSTVDISNIHCNKLNRTARDGEYCQSVEKLHECVTIANSYKTIILNKLKINELK